MLLLILVCMSSAACREGGVPVLQDQEKRCEQLLDLSRKFKESRNFTKASEFAIEALSIAESHGLESMQAEALCDIADIDISLSNDNHAWEYACNAAGIARRNGLDAMLARALLLKSRVCILADVSASKNRNEEALDYACEAYDICIEDNLPSERKSTLSNDKVGEELDGYSGAYTAQVNRDKTRNSFAEYQVEALLCMSQVYLNQNRWLGTRDLNLHRQAGDCLDKAETLASKFDVVINPDKIVGYRMRYYREGGEYEQAVKYCQKLLDGCGDDNYLMKLQAFDNLTALYARLGESDLSLASHDSCRNAMHAYYKQLGSQRVLELETEYETGLKEAMIKHRNIQNALLALIVLMCCALIIWLVFHSSRISRQRRDLQKANNVKGELLSFLSKDLGNPLAAQKSAVAELSSQCMSLSEEEIKNRCNQLMSKTEAMADDVANYMTELIMARQSAAANMGLTKREIEVLRLSADGMTIKEIADHLNISERTVGNHRSHIFDKMDVGNTSEMIRKARDYGII